MTLTEPQSPDGQKWLSNVLGGLTHDSTYVVTRPGYKEIVKYVIPEVRKSYRTTKMPTTLIKIDDKFWEKLMDPRSIYKYDVFKANIKPYTEILEGQKPEYYKYIEQFDHCWRPSSHYEFKPALLRNRRALKKAAGMPNGGKKAEALQGAIQYNSSIVKPSNSISKCWCIVPGYRTQQSNSTDLKVRLVWSIPCHIWQMECEAFDDSITKTSEEAKKLTHTIQVFYFDARANLTTWMNKFGSEVQSWVNVDSSQYDSSVEGAEITAAWHYFAPKYEHINLLADYAKSAELRMPEVIVHRVGGMPSGSKGTNMGDGVTNVGDLLEVLDRIRLLRFVVCVLVNGDDITIGFSTKITMANMTKLAQYTRRRVSAEKSEILDDAIWNSKWYCNGVINTRPIARALNSLMYKERESSALTANAVYVAIARHQILMDVEQHPCFEVLAKYLAKYEEVPWHKAKDDPRFAETVEYYLGSHDYLGEQQSEDLITSIDNSRYAKEFAT